MRGPRPFPGLWAWARDQRGGSPGSLWNRCVAGPQGTRLGSGTWKSLTQPASASRWAETQRRDMVFSQLPLSLLFPSLTVSSGRTGQGNPHVSPCTWGTDASVVLFRNQAPPTGVPEPPLPCPVPLCPRPPPSAPHCSFPHGSLLFTSPPRRRAGGLQPHRQWAQLRWDWHGDDPAPSPPAVTRLLVSGHRQALCDRRSGCKLGTWPP